MGLSSPSVTTPLLYTPDTLDHPIHLPHVGSCPNWAGVHISKMDHHSAFRNPNTGEDQKRSGFHINPHRGVHTLTPLTKYGDPPGAEPTEYHRKSLVKHRNSSNPPFPYPMIIPNPTAAVLNTRTVKEPPIGVILAADHSPQCRMPENRNVNLANKVLLIHSH